MYKNGFKETMSSLPSPISKPAGTQEVINLYNSVISWKHLSWAHETYLWITAWWPPMSTQHLQVAFHDVLDHRSDFRRQHLLIVLWSGPKTYMVWVLEISNLISHQNHSDPAHLGLHDVGVLPHMDLMLVAHDACPGLNFGFASVKNLS